MENDLPVSPKDPKTKYVVFLIISLLISSTILIWMYVENVQLKKSLSEKENEIAKLTIANGCAEATQTSE